MAEASDFKFGLGFVKTHYKILPRGKNGRGLGKLFNIWGSPLIFMQYIYTSFFTN